MNASPEKPALLSRISERIGNPLQWSFVDKTLLILAVRTVIYIDLTLFEFVTALRPDKAPQFINIAATKTIINVNLIHLGLLFLTGAVLLGLRRKKPDTMGPAYWLALIMPAQDVWNMAAMGHTTNPSMYLLVFLHLFIGLLFFNRTFLHLSLISNLGYLAVHITLEELGLIRYAWALNNWPVQDGRLDPAWLISFSLIGAATLATMLGAVAYVFRRWREHEHNLGLMTERLSESNQALEASLDELQRTQNQLVESEKMAALGQLVAGVAHEVNTPVGTAVTAASHLEERTGELRKSFTEGRLKKSDLERFADLAGESSRIILTNLNRASEIVQSFKQTAVDQSTEERRRFNLKAYLEDTLISLSPRIKRTSHQVRIEGREDIELESYPGALAQIVSNLIENSLTHAFGEKEGGLMTFSFSRADDEVIVEYADDGSGAPPEVLERVFDPFFTTRRGAGGSGLGMHIVYNLVTRSLGGRIEISSGPGTGLGYEIRFPVRAPDNPSG